MTSKGSGVKRATESWRGKTDGTHRGCEFSGCRGDEAQTRGDQNDDERGKKAKGDREEKNGIGGSR